MSIRELLFMNTPVEHRLLFISSVLNKFDSSFFPQISQLTDIHQKKLLYFCVMTTTLPITTVHEPANLKSIKKPSWNIPELFTRRAENAIKLNINIDRRNKRFTTPFYVSAAQTVTERESFVLLLVSLMSTFKRGCS